MATDASADDYTAVLLQGSGSYAVEATFSTSVPQQDAKVIECNLIRYFSLFCQVLIIENGAYGQRMVKICRTLNIPHDVLSFGETERVQVDQVAEKLKSNRYTHVAIIHCETSSGILNPIDEIGQLLHDHGSEKGLFESILPSRNNFTSLGSIVYIVDSMSAFGAVPVSLRNGHITYIISSANKCIEGVPGFSFVISKKQHLLKCQGEIRYS